MISNDLYNELKNIKGDRSFSELIKELLVVKKGNGKEIAKFYGALKEDEEYNKINKSTKKKWGEWTKKYA